MSRARFAVEEEVIIWRLPTELKLSCIRPGAYVIITFKAAMTPLSHPYDPAFAEDDAKIILQSSDDTLYRMHSFTLRTTSGFFRAMLTLPQHDSPPADDHEERITLDEPSVVLGPLLRIISGFRIQNWESYDQVEGVLAAAEKYDMEGALSIVRSAITSPSFLEQPLKLYAIAARYGWEEEAKLASKRSLALSIHDAEYTLILERIPSVYLLRLLRLHRGRSIEFEKLASKDEKLLGIHSCIGCACRITSGGPLLALFKSIVIYLDRRPAGDDLLNGQWKKWPEMQGKVCSRGNNTNCTLGIEHPHYTGRITTSIEATMRLLTSTI
jgi:hypothetical protein